MGTGIESLKVGIEVINFENLKTPIPLPAGLGRFFYLENKPAPAIF
jgi:hypothetical protein